jgi:Fe-S-cluster containining protein
MHGPDEGPRLKALSWQGLKSDLVDASVVTNARVGDGTKRTACARRPDGACVFLGIDNRCRIHQHFGEEEKPLMCRLFPFGFFPVGSKIAVDVSYACRFISSETSARVRESLPEWAALLRDGLSAETGHQFSKKYRVLGEILWQLEHSVWSLLAARRLSLLDRVRAVSDFMRLVATADSGTESAVKLREIMIVSLGAPKHPPPGGRAEGKTRRDLFYYLLVVSLKPTPAEVSRLEDKARHREVRRRVHAADGFKFPEARPWLDNVEMATSYQQVSEVGLGFLDSEPGRAYVEPYLTAKLLGQRFMREGDKELPFLEAVPRLLLLVPMFTWTAKASAANRDAQEISSEDVRRSARLLDRSYGGVRLSDLPAKQRKAWQFVLMETDFPVATCLEAFGG